MSESQSRVLVVEDEANIRRFVRMALSAEGYEVVEAETVQRALIETGTRCPNLVVLDLGLPDGDGIDFIRDLRCWATIPVIVLSAREGVEDKIASLDAGADDYLVKPFSADELMARVRVQLRRHAQQSPSADPVVAFGSVRVDLSKRLVERDGQPLHLTPIEYRLLTHLIAHVGRVVTHRELLNAVWGPVHVENLHYVRVHMANLRKKVELDTSLPRHLITEAGVGYRFVLGNQPAVHSKPTAADEFRTQ